MIFNGIPVFRAVFSVYRYSELLLMVNREFRRYRYERNNARTLCKVVYKSGPQFGMKASMSKPLGPGWEFPVLHIPFIPVYRYTVKKYARFPVNTAQNSGITEKQPKIPAYPGKSFCRLYRYQRYQIFFTVGIPRWECQLYKYKLSR